MRIGTLSLLILWVTAACGGAQNQKQGLPLIDPANPLPEVFSDAQISQVVKSVDRGLSSLQALQAEDGSFRSLDYAQPGITALGIMAYLSRGHIPGEGPYGASLDKAISYVLAQQKASGLFSTMEIDYASINIPVGPPDHRPTTNQSYSHAITMLMLGEVYGLSGKQDSFLVRNAIEKGLKFTIQLWDIRKGRDEDDGGFRYTRPFIDGIEGDVSLTGWHAVSLRSVRNAGFDVPQPVMDRIAAFLIRIQNGDGGFPYSHGKGSNFTMTGAGTLCLALAGKQNAPETLRAAGYLSRFRSGNSPEFNEYPYYTSYYMTQVSSQLGGRLWVILMGECAKYLLPKQLENGLWPPDGSAARYGPTYSTSMAIISLTPTLQILPIYQR